MLRYRQAQGQRDLPGLLGSGIDGEFDRRGPRVDVRAGHGAIAVSPEAREVAVAVVDICRSVAFRVAVDTGATPGSPDSGRGEGGMGREAAGDERQGVPPMQAEEMVRATMARRYGAAVDATKTRGNDRRHRATSDGISEIR